MGMNNNQAGFITLSLLVFAISQSARASHASYTKNTVSGQLPEITVIVEPGSAVSISPIVKRFEESIYETFIFGYVP